MPSPAREPAALSCRSSDVFSAALVLGGPLRLATPTFTGACIAGAAHGSTGGPTPVAPATLVASGIRPRPREFPFNETATQTFLLRECDVDPRRLPRSRRGQRLRRSPAQQELGRHQAD